MATQVSNIPLAVDYTSRDYYSLRDELIARVKARVNVVDANRQWTGEDPADFGVALIEAFAYMGDIVNYYIDRIANESYLPTATQRKNIINLATIYGYIPSGYRPAVVAVQFTNTDSSSIELPAGTQLLAEVVCDDVVEQLIFTTIQDVVVPAADGGVAGTVSVNAVHGEDVSLRASNLSTGGNDIAGEFLGSSDGSPNQIYTLSENQVVEGSVVINVQNGDVYEPWEQVLNLADYGPRDAVYALRLDENNFVNVVFGDGVSGAIPNVFAGVKAVYSVGGGEVGNIATGLVSDFLRIPNKTESEVADIAALVSVTNTSVGIGGVNPESNDSIRTNAPRLLRAFNRAVSLDDYANLTLGVTNAGKANAKAESPTSITLYVSPQRNVGSLDAFPGYNATGAVITSEWTSLRDRVIQYLEDKTQIGISVTVSPPTYVPVNVNLTYATLPQYNAEVVEQAIKTTLLTKFDYVNVDFEAIITPEDIEFVLKQVEGVRWVRVASVVRATGQPAGITSLIGDPNELFVFQETGISIVAASADATLESLAVPSGTTLSPAFDSNFFSYNLLGVSTAQITLTPVTTEANANVTINGNAISAPVDTPSGEVTNIAIVVTANDNSTVKVYSVTVSRV
jgi:hypothetical protein